MTERMPVPAVSSETFFGCALACPVCRASVLIHSEMARCSACGRVYHQQEGIWRFLPAWRRTEYATFLDAYGALRSAEGWGGSKSAYYRSLPYVREDDPQRDIWQLRAQSFETLVDRVLPAIEGRYVRPLKVLDLGAGNGWLAYRLALRNHHVIAVDISVGARDGLGAHSCYDVRFVPVQAEFERIPLDDSQVDVVIFNGAFHYASAYEATLDEALRVLRRRGRIIVIDTPVFKNTTSGDAMMREKAATARREYDVLIAADACEGFLTHSRLQSLADRTGVAWQTYTPWRGWRWAVEPWRARLRGEREPARFPLIVGQPPPQTEVHSE